jgi:predicted DNA-binding transcriptional regulator AlpA
MLLNEQQASEFTNLPKKRLQQLRYYRRGPKFLKIGRSVRYTESDLRAYLESCIVEPIQSGSKAA